MLCIKLYVYFVIVLSTAYKKSTRTENRALGALSFAMQGLHKKNLVHILLSIVTTEVTN